MIAVRHSGLPGTKTLRYWLFVTLPSLVFFLVALRERLLPSATPAMESFFLYGAGYAGLMLAAAVAAVWCYERWPAAEPVFLGGSAILALVLINLSAPGLARGLDLQKYMVTCAPVYVPLLYGLYGLAQKLKRPVSVPLCFLIALLAPILLVPAGVALTGALAGTDTDASIAIILVLLTLIGVVFCLFSLRGLKLLHDGYEKKKLSVAVLVLYAGLLPLFALLGILLSRSVPGGIPGFSLAGFISSDMVAWFDTPLLFAPAAGVLLAIQPRGSGRTALVFFVLRLVLLPYTVSLLLFSLPYLPFSPVLVLFLGAGIPFVLVVGLCYVHIRRLADDYRFVKETLSPAAARVPLLLLGLLPLLAGGVIFHDRTMLKAAYDYILAPDYDRPVPAVSGATLGRIASFSGRGALPGQLPVFGALYETLVFENKPFSRETGKLLRAVFMGEGNVAAPREPWNRRNPSWRAAGETAFRPAAGDWESRVTLSMTNGAADNNEFVAGFSLPPGVRVSGLELEIDGRFRPAVHVKKSTALFAYESIVRRARDPAILYYTEGDTVRLRVFPFGRNETRRAVISFLHLAPFRLELETGENARGSINLEPAPAAGGDADRTMTLVASRSGGVFIPPRVKSALPVVKRTPYFHFLLDVSRDRPEEKNSYPAQVDALLLRHPALAAEARVSLVDCGVTDFPAAAPGWREALRRSRPPSGFYLERALRVIYCRPERIASRRYPVVVVLTPDPGRAVYSRSLADCRGLFPEADDYFLMKNGVLVRRDLTVHPATDDTPGTFADCRGFSVRAFAVGRGREQFIRDDGHGSFVFSPVDPAFFPGAAVESASPLFPFLAREFEAALFPARFAARREPGDDAGGVLMTRWSSFIVLENERDDQAVLAADKKPESTDKLFSMDEPDDVGWLLLAAAAGLVLAAAGRSVLQKKGRSRT